MSSTAVTVARRRPKWHPIQPPPPSPKILNLPRRIRHRKYLKKDAGKPSSSTSTDPLLDTNHNFNYYYYEKRKGKLEKLFGEEREFSRTDGADVPIVLLNSSASAPSSSLFTGRRERVEREEEEFAEENWKFQAEILRAECNFLRLEREVALKKLGRNRVKMERILKTAIQTLISGRKKILEGANASTVLEEEIEDLASKLVELQRNSGLKDNLELKSCSNFDKKTCLLQSRLAEIGGFSDENHVKELQDLADSRLSMNMSHASDKLNSGSGSMSRHESVEVESLSMKMEGLSKNMLLKIEKDIGSILSSTANSSVASSASTSKHMEYQEPAFSGGRPFQESVAHEDVRCTGRCKAIVRRIVEQVRSETEQWSQMQEMLRQVRAEIDELQVSRKFWEERALNSEHEVQHLQSAVLEWKEKALASENKANEKEKDLSKMKREVAKLTAEGIEQGQAPINIKKEDRYTRDIQCTRESTKDMVKGDKNHHQIKQSVDPPAPISLGKQLEKEKIMLCRLKEKYRAYDKGNRQDISTDRRRTSRAFKSGIATLPLQDIGNVSPSIKHNSKTGSSPLEKHKSKVAVLPHTGNEHQTTEKNL